MTPTETESILVSIPIGEAFADTSRAIWRRFDCGAEVTLQQKLNAMAKAGVIQRRERRTPSGFSWLYWRDMPAGAVNTNTPSTVLAAG